MTENILTPLIRFAADSLITIWFLRNLTDHSARTQLRAVWTFLLTLPLYFPIIMLLYSVSVFQPVLRFLIRCAAVYLYLLIAQKEKSRYTLTRAVYFSLIFFTVQNFFMIPVLRYFRNNGIPVTAGRSFNSLLAIAAEYVVRVLLLNYVSRKVDISRIRSEKISTTLLYIGLAVLQIYIRGLAKTGNDFELGRNLYMLLILTISLANIIFIESSQISLYEKEEMKLQNVLYQEQVRNVERGIERDEHTKELRHDLKNHLIAIKTISEDPVRVSNYIDSMLNTLEKTEVDIDTGNQLVNGLISHKAADALRKNIRTNCYADFSSLTSVSDTDLSVILGNALDNAIEAAEKVQDPERRRIHLKTGTLANMFFIRIENYYEEEPVTNNDQFLSTKKDRSRHGYGIRQIRNTVSKYNGSCSFDCTEDHIFRLTIMFPEPESIA